GNSFRNVVRLSVAIDGTALNVLVTHLDRSNDSERCRQLAAVAGLFLALAEPAVLMGDLNSGPDEPALQQLIATPGVDDPLRHLNAEQGRTRIDWILTRGLKCHDRGAIDTGASDHPCYWVDAEIR
ncbi:MAG TPA: endonuclease/exonuclease/phosphatase family protein, partial [Pirellulales bacterium]|nr:endonuclease/exonuclease/phosphatase family protein [Pirellulales bacterium]